MVAGLQGCQSFSFFVSHCVSLEKGERHPCVTLRLAVECSGGQRGGPGDNISFLCIWAKMQIDTEASLVSTSSN